MKGPLEENASAETTASTRPDVLNRRTGATEISGMDAVGAAMEFPAGSVVMSQMRLHW
jgi:hypothetical protein